MSQNVLLNKYLRRPLAVQETRFFSQVVALHAISKYLGTSGQIFFIARKKCLKILIALKVMTEVSQGELMLKHRAF